MIAVRPARTDAELEAWRQVRIAVLPNERCSTVEELRRAMTAESLYLLAELDGEVVGSGMANRSDLAGQGTLAPRVVETARRRGVGTALLHELAGHLERIGFVRAGSLVEDPGSLVFAQKFGFREVGREVEQVRVLGDEQRPQEPEGIEIVSVAERPELFERTYDLAVEAFQDFALDTPIEVSPEAWKREWLTWPEGSFVALAGGEVVGCAGLLRDEDHPDRAENSLTAVRRDWRRRGLASLLKRTTLAWAAEHGLREVYTWTQQGNEGMRTVNESLGYVTRATSIRVRGPLPLRS